MNYTVLAVIGALLIALYQIGAEPETVPAQAAAQTSALAANTREQFAVDLLAAIGNTQPSAETIAMVVEWTIAEDGSDGALNRNNPLNTTICGFNMIGAINGDGACGVGHYQGYQDGIDANAATLAQGNFSAIREALQTNDPEGAKQALWASPWASSHYNGGVDWPAYQAEAQSAAQAAPAGKKCPYTDTMAVGEGSYFDSTGSPFWGGQYGGMHLGDDFIGNPGDPVYAPFDMQIESVGRYDDPGRFGANIQARFAADNTLYYAGHLIDVYVSAGETVPACTVIGTLGATAGPHVHVKLASPDAPVPCEGSPPGPGGCIDPLVYWETH